MITKELHSIYPSNSRVSNKELKEVLQNLYDKYGLKVVGKAHQTNCVKMGSKIICGNEVTVPCDLYEGDIWYPVNGRVERAEGTVEQYNPQPIFAPQGVVDIYQRPVDLAADLKTIRMARG